MVFSKWAGTNGRITKPQEEALKVEALRIGIKNIPQTRRPRPTYNLRTWRPETITIRGKIRRIYRDLKTGRFIKKPKGFC
jgi:hypothetical protein